MGFIKYAVLGVIAVIAISVIAMATAKSVPEGHIGILLTSGKADPNYVPPGLKFVMPFIQDIVMFDVKNIKTNVKVAAASKDLQSVSGSIVVNKMVNPNVPIEVYQKIGLGYQSTVIDPTVQESVKQATAKFTANQLLNNREEVKNQIFVQVKERLIKYNITLIDLSITDMDFSKAVNAAIEGAATESQLVQKAKNIELRLAIEANQTVVKAEGEQRAAIANANALKQQTILEAEGQAEKVRLAAQAEADKIKLLKQAEAEGIKLVQEQLLKNPKYIDYIKANKWSGNLPTTLIDGNGTATLLNLTPQ